MNEFLSWASTNWYWILAVLLLIYPVIYGVLCIGIGFIGGYAKDPDLVFPKTFWNDVVRYRTFSSGWSWSKLIFNKWQRLCLLLSLFFVWGYIIFVLFWGLGWIWGRLWNLLVSAYQWSAGKLKSLYDKL